MILGALWRFCKLRILFVGVFITFYGPQCFGFPLGPLIFGNSHAVWQGVSNIENTPATTTMAVAVDAARYLATVKLEKGPHNSEQARNPNLSHPESGCCHLGEMSEPGLDSMLQLYAIFHTHMYVYMCMYMICMCMCMSMYMCIRIYRYIYIYVYVYACLCV